MKPVLFISILGAAIATGGCDTKPARQTETEAIHSDGGTDTGELFALTPEARRALEDRAKQGDGAAAYRISQHYGMAGGDSGIAGDPKNSAEETRWLKRAAEAGFEPAKFELAVKTGRKDCVAARKMLTELVESGSDATVGKSAQQWLNDEYLCG
jgi:hypothetical protein